MKKVLLLLLLIPILNNCMVSKAATRTLTKKRATECVGLCQKLDMTLGAVVIIMNSAGCVCEPSANQNELHKNTDKGKKSSAAAAGGAVIQALLEEQRRQNQSQSHTTRRY